MHQKLTRLDKLHYVPTEDDIAHDIATNCWCEPIEFSTCVAHRKKFKQSIPVFMPLSWEDKCPRK